MDETSDGGSAPAAPKKRGRKSQVKADSDLENGKDIDVDETRAPKKQRKSAASKAAQRSVEEEDEPLIGGMSRHMKMRNWEDLVSTVDTIERQSDGSLTVYFTLLVSSSLSTQKAVDTCFCRNTGERAKENSRICAERFPQKVCQVYFADTNAP